MKILIDADGCPVIKITEKIAVERSIPCIIVCDSAHMFKSEYCKVITTDTGADSTDMLLINMTDNGDIVITQDYGLAAMCLAKSARALNQNGLIYSENNIDSLLFSRHAGKKARRAGFRTKGPKKRTPEQDEKFIEALTSML